MKNVIPANKETRKEQAARLMQAILKALNCTADQYTDFQYNEGRKYIKYFLPGDVAAASMLENSKTFWNWWKNHWTNRDETFLELHDKYTITDKEALLQLYLHYNDGKMLAESIHPNSVVLDETCADMIKELIHDNEHHAA